MPQITIRGLGSGITEGFDANPSAPIEVSDFKIKSSKAHIPFELPIGNHLFRFRRVGISTGQSVKIQIYNNGHLLLERSGRPIVRINDTLNIEDLPLQPIDPPPRPPPPPIDEIVKVKITFTDGTITIGNVKTSDIEVLRNTRSVQSVEIVSSDTPDQEREADEPKAQNPFITINGVKYLADLRKIRDQSIPTRDKILLAGDGSLVEASKVLQVKLSETINLGDSINAS